MGGGGKGGGGTSTVNVNNMGTTTMDIVGLDDQKVELVLPQPFVSESKTELVLPQPLKSESRTELSIPEPIRTEGKNEMALDIRPLVMDMCVNINMGPMPETCIRQPYNHHFGLTLFGLEIMGFNISGESQIIIQDLPKQPQVAWGGQAASTVTREVHKHRPSSSSRGSQRAESGGLRIRIGS
jgi:hypothetical protein